MRKKESLKRESLKKESSNSEISAPLKLSGFSRRALELIKFILGICLLAFVYSATRSFLNEFSLLERPWQIFFWSGLVSFVIMYLFVWEPAAIYAKGQRLLEVFFSFFRPLVRVAPYVFPIYTIILFAIYGISYFIFKAQGTTSYFLFLFGFSLGLHLVFSAKSLRTKQGDFLKANYIFGFSLIYLVNVVLLAFCLNLVFNAFSFVNFANNSFRQAKDLYVAVFEQLFL